MVLCTEILRSTREREDPKLRKKLDDLLVQIAEEEDAEAKKKLEDERAEILDELFKRNVGVYGAINLRTDGNKALIAFKKEAGSATNRWFYYELEKDASGQFQVVPKKD